MEANEFEGIKNQFVMKLIDTFNQFNADLKAIPCSHVYAVEAEKLFYSAFLWRKEGIINLPIDAVNITDEVEVQEEIQSETDAA